MAKYFSLTWAFDAFEDNPTFMTKRMFGGMAAYVDGKMVMVIFENPDDKEYRGKTYDFDLWNGLLLPLEREVHGSLQKEFPALINHPVLPKWLYLPMSFENFESIVNRISVKISQSDPRFGIFPKPKKKSQKKKLSAKKTSFKTKKKIRSAAAKNKKKIFKIKKKLVKRNKSKS